MEPGQTRFGLVKIFWEGTRRRPYRPCHGNRMEMERRSPVWNLDTTPVDLDTSNLFLTLFLNKDMVSKDFSVFIKNLFERGGPLIDILNLHFLKLWAGSE